MRLGTIAGGSGAHSPTVYTVLAESARSHSRRYLAAESSLAGTAAVVILAWQPPWWPVALLALVVGLYACWGLLARRDTDPKRGRWERVLRVTDADAAAMVE